MTRAASVTGSSQADKLWLKMTDALVEKGWVTSPEVEAAFRSVPAYGHRAAEAAAALVSHLRAWDARGRDLPRAPSPTGRTGPRPAPGQAAKRLP